MFTPIVFSGVPVNRIIAVNTNDEYPHKSLLEGSIYHLPLPLRTRGKIRQGQAKSLQEDAGDRLS
jgi:hypothetical protein